MLRFLVAFLLVMSSSELWADEVDRFALPASDEGLPGAGPIRRYDWFQSLWKQRRSAWASQVDRDQQAVVFLGDSITQGWGDDFQGRFSGLKVANRGISGDTTRGMLIRLREDVLSLNPSAVVMLMGTNDLEEQASSQDIANNVRLIVDALKKHNASLPIILCQVFPSSESKKRPSGRIREINQLLADTVRGDAQVTLLDTWTLFANAQGDAKPEEMPDLLHLNEAGYGKWAAALRPVLSTLGFLETEPDPFQPEAGFQMLFNGSDLTGWGYRKTPDSVRENATKWLEKDKTVAWPFVDEPIHFDGKTVTPEGRYLAKNGRLIVTIPPEGRKIQQLYTTAEFSGNMTLRLEFRATPNADSGVFIREPQLQCRDYLLAGPYKTLKSYKPGDWNQLEAVIIDGVARCTCNGEVIEAAFKVPAIGPIGLEGDRGQMEFRRIRVRQDD